MNIEYTKHINTYDPVSVSWEYNGRNVELEFSTPITAIFSKQLNCVVVEIYGKGKLNFYSLDGNLISSEPLPSLDNYQFRGINKSIKSKTGISFLFYPIEENVGNQWRDIEQYELSGSKFQRLGKKLGIYR